MMDVLVYIIIHLDLNYRLYIIAFKLYGGCRFHINLASNLNLPIYFLEEILSFLFLFDLGLFGYCVLICLLLNWVFWYFMFI